MWALVVDGLVREITDIDPSGRFHPDLIWVPCGMEVREGWSFANGQFAEPPAPQPEPLPEPEPAFTRMADVWERSTEDEAQVIDQAIQTAPSRDRGLVTSTMRFVHGSAAFVALSGIVRGVITPKSRADEILAASEV